MTLLKLLWSFIWSPEDWLGMLHVHRKMCEYDERVDEKPPKKNRTMWG